MRPFPFLLRAEQGEKETSARAARTLDDKFRAHAESVLAKLQSDIDRSNAQDEHTDRTIQYVTCVSILITCPCLSLFLSFSEISVELARIKRLMREGGVPGRFTFSNHD